MIAVFILGCLIRVVYVLGTPYWVRAYDWEGHLQFIQYLLQHRVLPPFDAGWEFYQAPLYYVLASLWTLPFSLLQHNETQLWYDLQIFSLLLSFLSAGLLCWIAQLLFPEEEARPQRVLFAAFLIFFPGVVLFSSRISNDILAFPLSLVTFGLLVRWWRHRQIEDWLLLCCSIGLGLLVKNSAMLLLAACFASFSITPGVSLWKKILYGLVGFSIILGLAGWHTIPRALEEMKTDVFPVGNIKSLHSDLMVQRGIGGFIRFHPIAVLREPFNDPWGDALGRQNFWEFFYKSAFFGEFQFPPLLRILASLMLGMGMFLLIVLGPLGLYGHFSRACSLALPIYIVGLAVCLGQILLRWKLPYSPIQDFRFSLLLLVPVTYVLFSGMRLLRNSLQRLAFDMLYSFTMLNATFIALTSVLR